MVDKWEKRLYNIPVSYTHLDVYKRQEGEDLSAPVEIEFCTGSFSAVRTAEFKAVGGFDEHYFMYVEDADLTQKMRTKGKAYLVPQYTAIHAWHLSLIHISVTVTPAMAMSALPCWTLRRAASKSMSSICSSRPSLSAMA